MATENKIDIVIDLQTKNAEALARLEKQLLKTKRGSEEAGKGTRSFTKDMIKAEVIVGAFKQALGLATNAFKQLSAATLDYSRDAAKIRDLQKGFARSFGEDTVSSLNKLREASGGTINDLQLMQAGNRSALLGVTDDVGQLSQLMITARLRGREMGLDTTQAFNDIVTGIGRGSPLILDNLGIKIPDALKATFESMSEAEKTQAILNFAIEDGQQLLEEYGGVLELTASEKFGLFEASMDNARFQLGEMALDVLDATGAMDGLNSIVTWLVDTLTEAGRILMDDEVFMADLNIAANDLRSSIAKLTGNVDGSSDSAEDMAGMIGDLIIAFVEVSAVIVNTAADIRNFTDAVGDAISKLLELLGLLDQVDLKKNFGVTEAGGINIQTEFGTTKNVQKSGDLTTVTETANFSKGGIVPNSPIYASNGFFQPKGTDTVPAMLTPGEIVLPKGVSDSIRSILTAGGGAAVGGSSMSAESHTAGIDEYFNQWMSRISGMESEQIRIEESLQSSRIENIENETNQRIEELKFRAAQEIAEFEGTEQQKEEFRRNVRETTERDITDMILEENKRRADDYLAEMERVQDEIARQQAEATRIEEAAALQLSRLRIETIEDETERRIESLKFESEQDIKNFKGTTRQKREFEKLTKELLDRELAEIEQRNNPAAQQAVSIDLNRPINMPINIGTINENVDSNNMIKQIVRSIQHLELGIA